MKQFRTYLFCILTPLAGCLVSPAVRADAPDHRGIEVDARGPVHEAFAQPWQSNPSPNEAVDKKPPDPIPEEPAAEKPQGKNVQWMPGYWQWDTDRKDFVWVSGFWRDVPQDRRWVPGYWADTTEGNRWVSGHWAADGERDNQYVPEPPVITDEGPTTVAPDENSFYIPGTNFYGENGYYARPGYWADVRPGYVWVPARYIWSPYGYVFASGYWDYPLVDRGLLFAPAYFTEPLWLTSGWYYRPWLSVAYAGLYDSLFVGPRWGHYYFGDYYAHSYYARGYSPWFWHSARHYDPLWVHNHWVNRANQHWSAGLRSTYIARANGTAALPPRTFAAQSRVVAGANTPRMLNTFAQARQAGVRLEPLSAQQRAAQVQAARRLVNQSQHSSHEARQSVAQSHQFGATAPRASAGVHSSLSPGHTATNRAPLTGGHTGASVPPRSAPLANNGPTTHGAPSHSSGALSPNFNRAPSAPAPRAAAPPVAGSTNRVPSAQAPHGNRMPSAAAAPRAAAPMARSQAPRAAAPSARSQAPHFAGSTFHAPSPRGTAPTRPSHAGPSANSRGGGSAGAGHAGASGNRGNHR